MRERKGKFKFGSLLERFTWLSGSIAVDGPVIRNITLTTRPNHSPNDKQKPKKGQEKVSVEGCLPGHAADDPIFPKRLY